MNYLELTKNHSFVHHCCAIKYYQIRSDSTAVMNIFCHFNFSPVIKVGKAAERNPNKETMSSDSDDD